MYMGTERRSQSPKGVSRGQAITKGGISPADADELRYRAEQRLKAQAQEAHSPRNLDEARRLLQELEMHNAELRLARDEMDAALEKYSDLYDLAPVGCLTLDRDGAILAANLTGASVLGIDRFRLLGRRFGLLVADISRHAFTDFLFKVFTGPDQQSCEVPLLREGKLPLFVQIEAVAAASGEECRAVIIDITVRRQVEMNLEALHAGLAAHAAKLEDANMELEAFNYTVSHDLLSPLTSINGFSEVLMKICKEQLDEQSKGYLQGISLGALRMKGLIASLLDFSCVAHIEIRRETFDLSEMAKSVAAGLKLAQPESRVTFLSAEGITCNGDPDLCRIVLDNLLGNSWKYTADRVGTVIEFGMTELGGKPVYFVFDNGPGFEMAQASKLFIPFQRISDKNAGGHGIGLATVKRIVKRHGGRVWAESRPGEGATFFYTLE